MVELTKNTHFNFFVVQEKNKKIKMAKKPLTVTVSVTTVTVTTVIVTTLHAFLLAGQVHQVF